MNLGTASLASPTGGFVAQNIALAGAIDVEIDGVQDSTTNHGGIAMVLNGTLDFKVGSMDVYAMTASGNVTSSQAASAAAGAPTDTSMGGIEFSGITLNNVSMVLSGR